MIRLRPISLDGDKIVCIIPSVYRESGQSAGVPVCWGYLMLDHLHIFLRKFLRKHKFYVI